MRRGALLACLLAVLSGCAVLRGAISPPPPAESGLPPAEQPTPPASAPPVPVVRPAAPPPAPPLTPQMSAEEERRLREEVEGKIGETGHRLVRLVQQLEGREMKPEERETFLTAQRFLEQARKALAAREYQRAANLAAKARALSDDLAKTTK
ncbi:MAG: hypothetical protein HYV61_03690 [Candidatus Rokubacteria bacterium]|nr:hypothetical protein [Candidatus Rokubacteria bacterium]